MATFVLIFAYPWSFKVFYLQSQIDFNLLKSILQLNNLSVSKNAIKEEPNMHILYFGCLATNLLDFFINILLRVAMVTMLAMYILPKVWPCAADCNLCYLNKTLFILIAFDYMILTFKVNRSAKNTRYFLET